MKLSLTYHLTLFVLKLKGIKKAFSQDPIDVSKIRKGDVHQPDTKLFKNKAVRNFKILDSNITEVKGDKSSGLLLFIHGGGFISGPAQHHWETISEISKSTNKIIWLCNYPKAPENKIGHISGNIDAVYRAALKYYKSDKIKLIGDSVGGTLITTLIQRLNKTKIKLPAKIILVSPVMDASMENSKIDSIDKLDPMLSKVGVLSAKQMCAGDMSLHDSIISPINGSFDNFPETIIYIAENDITYPDQKIAIQKMMAAKIKLEVIDGKKMPHIWPLLPVMAEAKHALKEIIEHIK